MTLPPQDHASWKELVNSAGPDGTARTNLRDDVRHSNSCQESKPATCSSVASEVAIGFAIPKTKMPLQSRLPSWPLCVSACLESELSVCFLSGLKAWLGHLPVLPDSQSHTEPVLSHWRSSAFRGGHGGTGGSRTTSSFPLHAGWSCAGLPHSGEVAALLFGAWLLNLEMQSSDLLEYYRYF